jgi:protein involved in polysaccharide export with SLBB domain
MIHKRRKRDELYATIAILVLTLLIPPWSTAAAGSPPAAATAAPCQCYVLGPGDLLEISVWGYPDLTRQVPVAPGGEVILPLVGSIGVSGLSVERVAELISKAYTEFIIAPHVMVTIKEYRRLHVSVLGQVAHPGSYDLPQGARLLDALAAGGGPTDAAALKEARILRAGQPPIPVDLTRVVGGDPALNVLLADEETLVVPEDLTGFVILQGEVVRPGRYRLKGDMRVLDALSLAGGLTERASLTQATLARTSSRSEPLVLDDLLLHQNMGRNIALQPGDVLFIPEELNNKIYVIGDVKTPGVFPLKGNLTLLQAVAMAGGPEQRGPGTAKTAYIVRRNGDTQQNIVAGPAKVTALANGRSMITADLTSIMHDPSQDIAVQSGDVLVVPMSGMGGFQLIASILAGIGYIFK